MPLDCSGPDDDGPEEYHVELRDSVSPCDFMFVYADPAPPMRFYSPDWLQAGTIIVVRRDYPTTGFVQVRWPKRGVEVSASVPYDVADGRWEHR